VDADALGELLLSHGLLLAQRVAQRGLAAATKNWGQ
jgi:hypothetical protein